MYSKFAFWTWVFWILLLWCRKMSITALIETPTYIPHRAAPYEVATGSIHQRLKLSTSVPSSQDSLHFREVGSISGDTGYIHVGIKSDMKQYQDTLNKVTLDLVFSVGTP